MIRPHIFAACDNSYYKLFAAQFIESAEANGHTVQVFCNGEWALDRRAHHAAMRFRLLPLILLCHPAVLVLDVDSVIREPIEIEPEYDLGVFPRLDKADEAKRIMGGIFYCTDRAREFAIALAHRLDVADEIKWGDDQTALWRTYDDLKDKFRIKKFTTRTFDWENPKRPRIYTAKGLRKIKPEFIKAA
jgi:hypothetical protein